MEKMHIKFRETGYYPKVKNHMLRTTLGLRDEASSDTVSTEFNYLQPTVKRLEVNPRMSFNQSSVGGTIQVQEHNLTPAPEEISERRSSLVIAEGNALDQPENQTRN